MASFWRGLFRYESAKIAPWLALRNAIGVALPLAAGVVIGHASSGLIGATGALNVAFSDGTDPYRHRLRRMLAASLCCALAVVAGGISGRHPLWAAPLIAVCGFTAGMMVALGTEATDIANVTLVTLIVFLAQAMTPEQTAASGLAALGGGVLQTALALGSWPFHRYRPERRVLAQLCRELARTAGADPRVHEPPPVSTVTTQAQLALASLGGTRSLEAERYLGLLSQAERIRLAVLALSRLRVRLGREDGAECDAAALERCLEIAGQALTSVAESLESGEDRSLTLAAPIKSVMPPKDSVAAPIEELRAIAASFRQRTGTSPCSEMLQDARWQMDALAGQLRSALELAAHATPGGTAEFERQEASRPWRLRIGNTAAVLRANLHLNSAVFRHAVRLAVSLTVAELLARQAFWQRPYWIVMTVSIVLRPDFTTTFSRGVLRIIGTLAGLGLATALFHMLPPSRGFEVLLVAAFAFLLRCFGPANYGIFALNLTALVVVMFAMTGVAPGPVISARGLSTLAGGAIALAAYQAWPTWERAQAREALARMLEAYRVYFQAVRDAYLHPDERTEQELARARQAARLGRSNAEASAARVAVEPGVAPELVTAFHRLLANSHRLIHAAMSLEAGLVSRRAVPARDEFRTFANHVDLTLYYLSAALRGTAMKPEELPDLREDHEALLQSAGPADRYSLVNVEADRITNSLNTLSLEVFGMLPR